jgi:hypothetical protein
MQQCVHRLRQNPHLGFNAKVERLQQGQTTRHSPPLKGMLLLKRKPHVGVIAIGNALGNSIVSGLSTKSNQPGQLSPQTQRELEQAEKSGQVSAELARKVVEETSRGLSVGLKGSTLKVTDGKTNWGGDLNEMTSYGNLMTARRSLLSEFDMSSNSGRALDMGFMQMQAAQMRQMTQTPIEESAAYLQGMARGEARYNHINRDRIAQQQRQVQTTRQLDTLNKQTWQADQARAKMTTLEKVQLGFDIAGMTEIPGISQIAELGSAGISLYNGDYVGAGLGVASMIPIAGKWAEVAKMDRLTERVNASNGAIDLNRLDNLSPGFYTANPSDLRFTQSDASPFFSDGRRVDTLIDDLRAGRVTPDQVGNPLQVVNLDGKLFSIDNRRLAAFSQSGITDVPIEIVSLKNPAVSQRFWDRFDPIDGEGLSITIATTKQRVETQQLLQSLGKIRGVQLGQ